MGALAVAAQVDGDRVPASVCEARRGGLPRVSCLAPAVQHEHGRRVGVAEAVGSQADARCYVEAERGSRHRARRREARSSGACSAAA